MTTDLQQTSSVAGRPVWRRRHVKEDGRELFLYGHAKPSAVTVGESLLAAPTVSELRRHPLRGEWSVYAGGRQNRTYKPATIDDPLAPARAGAAPTEIPFTDFEIAVIENRFPSFSFAGSNNNIYGQDDGFDRAKAGGRCEVVIYTPAHEGSLATLSAERRRLLVEVWIDRYAALFAMGCKAVLPFENRGEEVGVTLHHPHGQIYGFGFTPRVQADAARAFEGGYDLSGALKNWRTNFEIAEQGGVVAFAPPFARFPYETWLAPFARREGLWDFSADEREGLAALLGDMTRRYDQFFGRPCPYMLSLHAAPGGGSRNYHFTAQFYPLLRSSDKIKYLASVEQATGVFTVDVLPEAAAAALRAL